MERTLTPSAKWWHTNVKTNQVYAKVVDEKKEKEEKAIRLNINNK